MKIIIVLKAKIYNLLKYIHNNFNSIDLFYYEYYLKKIVSIFEFIF